MAVHEQAVAAAGDMVEKRNAAGKKKSKCNS